GCWPRNVPVRGVVTLDDRPLAGALVTFHHQDPDGQDASGITNANGEFELTPRKQGGALPGSYKVTVTYSEPVEVAPSANAEDVQKAMVKASAGKKARVVLPPIYTQVDQTILQHRIPDDGDARLVLKSVRQ